MNKKKFLLLIEDDCEVMGNGLGNVMEHQFLPSLMMMELAQKYNVKMTFMVDVAHQLTLRHHLDDTKLRIQSELWDDMVLLMKSMEFDVQLHLHPQWVGAKYEDGNFFWIPIGMLAGAIIKRSDCLLLRPFPISKTLSGLHFLTIQCTLLRRVLGECNRRQVY